MQRNDDLDRRLRELRTRGLGAKPTDSADEDTPPAYGFQSLALSKKEGERWGFPYASITSHRLNKERTLLVVQFSFHEVTVKGRGLDGLFDRILTRACGSIAESAGSKDFAEGEETTVESIQVRDMREGEG